MKRALVCIPVGGSEPAEPTPAPLFKRALVRAVGASKLALPMKVPLFECALVDSAVVKVE